MSKTRLFVSFDYHNDKNIKDLLVGQSRNSDSPFEIADWSMKEAAPDPKWEEEAEQRIKRSDVVVVLLGSKTYHASGVKKEVRMARDNDVRIFQLKPKDTNPISVTNAGTVYNWTWDNLRKLLA
jgi:hypothetical protein